MYVAHHPFLPFFFLHKPKAQNSGSANVWKTVAPLIQMFFGDEEFSVGVSIY